MTRPHPGIGVPVFHLLLAGASVAEAIKPTMLDPEVTQATLDQTICFPGYSSKVQRDDFSESQMIRKEMLAA